MCHFSPHNHPFDLLPILLATVAVKRTLITRLPTAAPRAESRTTSACPRCGYDLQGVPNNDDYCTCPECGTSVDLRAAHPSMQHVWHWRGVVAFLLVIACVSLPWIVTKLWACVLMVIGTERAVMGAANSLSHSAAWSDGGPQSMIAGSVSAISVAMFCGRSLGARVWAGCVALAAVAWVVRCVVLAMPRAFVHGWLWETGEFAVIGSINGALVGLATCLVMWAGTHGVAAMSRGHVEPQT